VAKSEAVTHAERGFWKLLLGERVSGRARVLTSLEAGKGAMSQLAYYRLQQRLRQPQQQIGKAWVPQVLLVELIQLVVRMWRRLVAMMWLLLLLPLLPLLLLRLLLWL